MTREAKLDAFIDKSYKASLLTMAAGMGIISILVGLLSAIFLVILFTAIFSS